MTFVGTTKALLLLSTTKATNHSIHSHDLVECALFISPCACQVLAAHAGHFQRLRRSNLHGPSLGTGSQNFQFNKLLIAMNMTMVAEVQRYVFLLFCLLSNQANFEALIFTMILGGWPAQALAYTMDHGLEPWTTYPYQGQPQQLFLTKKLTSI